ncbi:hypothetical protein COCSADRAFT_76802, partial [Bipolaris sorokiniana ND90Pr]
RASKVESAYLEIVTKYNYYKEKSLRYFINTASRQYTGCITIKAEYSLFISNKD